MPITSVIHPSFSGWVRWSGGRLHYAGRISRAPFNAWSGTPRGQAAIAQAAEEIRFGWFGRNRRARAHLWRELSAAAQEPRVKESVQHQVERYLNRLSALAFGEGLPRASVDLHRLVVVPSVLVNAAAYSDLVTVLNADPVMGALTCGDELREFFCLTLIAQMEAATAELAPSPKRPVPAGRGWASVGLNRQFVWRVPFEAPDWSGHHYVFELTHGSIARGARKQLLDKIVGLESALPSLSKSQRADILRRAVVAA
jgi:hypothetical protein